MKKIIGFIICTLLITATGFSVVGTDESREEFNKNYTISNLEHSPPLTGLFEWPMFRYGLNNSGYSPSLAPDDNTVLWSKYIGDWVDSNPTIKDEKLYIVGDNYHQQGGADLWCLNPFTGDEIWKTNIPDEFVWGSPTVANDRVYVLGTYFNLYCYDANNGDLLWDFESYGHCGPMVVEDKLYFGCSLGDKNGFYCLNATTGEIIWVHDPITPYSACTPAIVDGKVYIGNGWYFYCLDAETGAEIWNSPDKSDWGSAAVSNNRVYTSYWTLYCLDAEDGDELWTYPNGDIHCSPAIAYGNMYIGNDDGKVYCFDADTGDMVWTSPSLGISIFNDVAVADGKVYTCSAGYPATFNCLDAYTGDIIWQFDFIVTGYTYSSPAVAYGNVYVGAGEDGYIYAFGTPNEPPEIPSKPDGPSEGIIGVEYTFSTNTTDPEGDNIYYLFDWGDGENSGWIGPYNSGEMGSALHVWDAEGDYDVTVQAKDIYNGESNWSDPNTITIIEGPILDIQSIKGGLFKVSAEIKNTGGVDAIDGSWSITLDGGAFIGKETTGTDDIPAGGKITVTSKLILGLGATTVTVTVESAEGVSDTREQSGFVFLFFIKVNSGG